MWSQRYDQGWPDIFDVQDEISLAIVKALKVKLLGEEKRKSEASLITRKHTSFI